MPRRKNQLLEEDIVENLDYLGLDLNKIPAKMKEVVNLEFKIPRVNEENKYRQYRYIPVNDIQILISPTNRMTELSEKYKMARPLIEYLDGTNEENHIKYTAFINMLKEMNISEIEAIEEEQKKLNKKIPFKVKFQGNYLWQIYYAPNVNKYFMIVPTEDINHSAFFYLLKKQIEDNKDEKIYVPVSYVKYSNKYLKKSEFEDIENYLWLFTKDWPSIYEVFNQSGKLTIHITGETNVFEKVKTIYKIMLENEDQAKEFYKLLKALFILQTELPNFYDFKTRINDDMELEFYFENEKIEYKNMVGFLREQFKLGLKRRKELKREIRTYNKKLKELKQLVATQEIEYIAKEKQISTFLECKKSFFGKFKYYFKYNKKKNKKNNSPNQEDNENLDFELKTSEVKDEVKKEKKKIPIKKVYTLEEVITSYKELEELENEVKNLLMDINALKLKNKNMAKKIENASKYIEEIDSHKKSIFEFWKYSNKDEIDTLPEGEQEEINVIKKIEKVFNYEEDLEKFGINLDKMQRKNLTPSETDSVYIATTKLIEILNKIKTNSITPEEIEKNLKEIKSEQKRFKELDEEEYDIFGNMIEDSTKIKKLKDKKHRENSKDKFDILEISRNTRAIGYKLTLEMIVQTISKALEKGIIPESLPLYKASVKDKIDEKELNVFNINLEEELKSAIEQNEEKINLFKVNVKEGSNGIGFTNIIFFDNQNKTLPVGMDISTKILLDTSKIHLKLVNKNIFKIATFESRDDFSNINIKEIQAIEYDMIDIEDLKNEDE